MQWDQIVTAASPYVVRIDTPEGSGTGFLCLYNSDRTFVGIATAAHVVARADDAAEIKKTRSYRIKV